MVETLHVVSLPHTQTTEKFLHCAYTQKVVKFCKMMLAQGRRVILYSGDENEAECTEHVPLFSEQWRTERFGAWDKNGLFGNITWNPADDHWRFMNARAIEEIRKRRAPKDLLCLVSGWPQSTIAEALPELMPVEWAVGYTGIHLAYRVFESYAWMHHVYGLKQIEDGAAYDTVIPNFFDLADFQTPKSKGGYLLFVGRVIPRKGPHVAAEIAERAGLKLLIAGPGVTHVESGLIRAPGLEIKGTHVEYVGSVGKKERTELMSGALALMAPTLYIEPFGGVSVEAMMCGTPVVASDWGAFTETVIPGQSGERFRTLQEGVDAISKARSIPAKRIREYAKSRFSLESVGPQFDKHFNRLTTLWSKGWYT